MACNTALWVGNGLEVVANTLAEGQFRVVLAAKESDVRSAVREESPDTILTHAVRTEHAHPESDRLKAPVSRTRTVPRSRQKPEQRVISSMGSATAASPGNRSLEKE